jgi:hypothetical protein
MDSLAKFDADTNNKPRQIRLQWVFGDVTHETSELPDRVITPTPAQKLTKRS